MTDINIYFNVYTESRNSFWIFFGHKVDGKFVLNQQGDGAFEIVNDYMTDHLEDFSDYDKTGYYEKQHDLSFKLAKEELKKYSERLIDDGFKFSEELGEIGYENWFSGEGGDYPNPIFLSSDFNS